MRQRGEYVYTCSNKRVSCTQNAMPNVSHQVSSHYVFPYNSSILHDPHLRRPQHPPIKPKPLLLRMETAPILLIRLWRLEHCLMHIRIELLACLTRIEAFQAMFLQRVNQYRVRHLDAVVQRK